MKYSTDKIVVNDYNEYIWVLTDDDNIVSKGQPLDDLILLVSSNIKGETTIHNHFIMEDERDVRWIIEEGEKLAIALHTSDFYVARLSAQIYHKMDGWLEDLDFFLNTSLVKVRYFCEMNKKIEWTSVGKHLVGKMTESGSIEVMDGTPENNFGDT